MTSSASEWKGMIKQLSNCSYPSRAVTINHYTHFQVPTSSKNRELSETKIGLCNEIIIKVAVSVAARRCAFKKKTFFARKERAMLSNHL